MQQMPQENTLSLLEESLSCIKKGKPTLELLSRIRAHIEKEEEIYNNSLYSIHQINTLLRKEEYLLGHLTVDI